MRFEESLARAAGQERAIVVQVPWADGFDSGREDLGDPMPGLTATTRRTRGSGTTEACS